MQPPLYGVYNISVYFLWVTIKPADVGPPVSVAFRVHLLGAIGIREMVNEASGPIPSGITAVNCSKTYNSSGVLARDFNTFNSIGISCLFATFRVIDCIS